MTQQKMKRDYISKFDGKPCMMVATFSNANKKIGSDVVQTWYFRNGIHIPSIERKHNRDFSVCGDCPMKPGCYVDLWRGPDGLWTSVLNGNCQPWNIKLFKDRIVRLGAFGDSLSHNVRHITDIAKHARCVIGYTQQWRRYRDSVARYHIMASVMSDDDAKKAKAYGWRYFKAVADGYVLKRNEIWCRHYEHGLQCADCRLCIGQQDGKLLADVCTPAHGNRKKQLLSIIGRD